MSARMKAPLQLRARPGGTPPKQSAGPAKTSPAHDGAASALAFRRSNSGSERESGHARADYFRSPAVLAAEGTRGSGERMPHLRAVQESFGRHDINDVRAHLNDDAARASAALGADAFTTGNDTAFRSAPDLRIAAHEAAHVIQQRAGVQLEHGLGREGDAYERHAEAVAERVVRGESAEALLDRMAAPRDGRSSVASSGTSTVQRAATKEAVSETTDTGNKYTQNLEVDTDKNTVVVSLAVKFVKSDTWANDDAFKAFVAKVKAAIATYMNNVFTIVATPKAKAASLSGADAGTAADAGGVPFEMPCAVKVIEDSAGTPVNCHGGKHGVSAMQTGSGDLYELGQDKETTLPAVTIAHEFGHALMGASDEYANPAVPDRKISDDHSIMGQYYVQGIDAAEFKVRHFEHLLAPVAAHFPGFTMSLKKT